MGSSSDQAGNQRLWALVETMRSFAEAAHDFQRLLEVISHRTTEFLADGCAIFLLSEDGAWLRAATIYNRDPETMRTAQAAFGEPLSVQGPGPTATAARTGQPVLIPQLTPEVLAERFRPATHETLSGLAARSLLSVPLLVRGKVLGVLALSRHGQRAQPFSADDQALSCTIADHAALALTNARLLASLQAELQERQRAEAEATKFVALVQHSRDFVAMAGLDGRVLFINQAGCRLVGLDPGVDFRTLKLSDFHTQAGMSRAAVLLEQGRWEGEGVLRHFVTGELIPTQVSSFVAHTPDGQPLFATVQRDLREQRRLEEHLRYAQKMEAIGRLAGGVAHDFNNLLFIILSYAGALARGLPKDSLLRGHAEQIQRTAESGASLTRQLLAFSRQQSLEPLLVDLGEVVTQVQELIRRLVGPAVEVQVAPGAGLRRVRVDVGQMEQVLLNLAANARDAMPGGGKLTLALANVELGPEAAGRVGCPPGPYVRLAVSDTGVGIDPAVRSRIFDPFFTTKPSGQGTGLGLSIVFGVVQQSGGYLAVSSEPGQGSTFELYLPVAEAAPAPPRPPTPAPPPGGSETILLVEDDPQVCSLIDSILKEMGYRVLPFAQPREALGAFAQHREVDLLLADVALPEMTGPELAMHLVRERPRLRVLFLSGHTEVPGDMRGATVVHKPLSREALLQHVRHALDA